MPTYHCWTCGDTFPSEREYLEECPYCGAAFSAGGSVPTVTGHSTSSLASKQSADAITPEATMKNKSYRRASWIQLLAGVVFFAWGTVALIYQSQPGKMGLKPLPVILVSTGLVNLVGGTRRLNRPEICSSEATRGKGDDAST